MSTKLTEMPKITEATFLDGARRHALYSLGQNPERLTAREAFQAVALATRDKVIEQMIRTDERHRQADAKRLYYLSMEFLMGRSLHNNLCNLGILDLCRRAAPELGASFADMEAAEPDAALGNGGLGRLAACFLDSLASMDLPGFGYGINYEFGLFRQGIRDGYQREMPDHWLAHSTPWQIERPGEVCLIPIGGRVEDGVDRRGNYNPMWLDWKLLIGVPNDMPVVGYGGRTVNYLRLFSARSSSEFDMDVFNAGAYIEAVKQKIESETVSKVLYPEDSLESGKELRLTQEYFLVACAIRDMVRRFTAVHRDWRLLPDKVAIHMNDTHPALAVAELMRVLIDENDLEWDEAWSITQKTCAYTNHTLMPEALEKWSVPLFEYLLPRHLQIIHEINRRFLDRVESIWPDDPERTARMSIIEEAEPKQVRMGNLSMIGSHAVNGVSGVHTELLVKSVASDFHDLWPERFTNKTNGVTQRRWMLVANPRPSERITTAIGPEWITDLDRLRQLESHAEEGGFRSGFAAAKRENKERLAKVIHDTTHVVVDPDSLFDVHVKRIHEYKRQTLNVLHIMHEYLRLLDGEEPVGPPRTYIFAGKAAPGYWEAKQIIKMIHNVARTVNNDPRTKDRMKVVFVPDYRVSLAEVIIPAADLSEQVSTAGTEASGTSNMKFALNGALTVGTIDGANIEMREAAGEENFYAFGLTTDEIEALWAAGDYDPWSYYHSDSTIRRVLDALDSDLFAGNDPEPCRWLRGAILERGDGYLHLPDLRPYLDIHDTIGREYLEREGWARKAILNVARMGRFSSDRTIREYADEIWGLRSV